MSPVALSRIETNFSPSLGRRIVGPFHITAWLKASPAEVNPPDALCESTGQSQPSPTDLTVTGAGFGPNNSVTLEFVSESKSGFTTHLGTAKTNAKVDFTTTLTVPAAPFGKYVVTGDGKAFYGRDQDATSNMISLGFDACDNPSIGGGSVSDNWQGVGTDANTDVLVILDGSPVMMTTSDADGSWTANKSFPCSPGPHTYGLKVSLGGVLQTFTAPLSC